MAKGGRKPGRREESGKPKKEALAWAGLPELLAGERGQAASDLVVSAPGWIAGPVAGRIPCPAGRREVD